MLGMWAAGPRRSPRRSRSSRACVLGSWYSVPARLARRRVQVRLGASQLEVLDGGTVVAVHPRSLHKGTQDLVLDHYLGILVRKPGAFAGSATLAQARAGGVFTAGHQRFWDSARRGGPGRDRRRAQGRLDRPGAGLYRGSPHHRHSRMSGHPDHPGAATLRPARAHPRRLRHPARRHPHWSPAMTTGPVLSEPAAEAAIGAACQVLHLPTVGAQAVELADQAARDRLTHRAYLAELLSAETDTRDARRRDRRVKEAKFPRVKRLADFDLSAAPGVAPATLAALASGTWIDTAPRWSCSATPEPA